MRSAPQPGTRTRSPTSRFTSRFSRAGADAGCLARRQRSSAVAQPPTSAAATSCPVAATPKTVINNEVGATSILNAEDVSTLPNTLAALIGSTFSRTAAGIDSFAAVTASAAQTAASAALQPGAGFETAQTGLSNQLNQAGADSNYLDSQITFNSDKIDSLNAGLGALVDADLSKESALLQSLQIKQQLGTQALSIANQSPQSLLSLFKS